MSETSDGFIRFKANKFSARLPLNCKYTPSHYWLRETEPGLWRVGLTSFATRMLGEIVEFDFEVKTGEGASLGQTIGWIEGFKAVADIYCVAEGTFVRGNPKAMESADCVGDKPFEAGWLYELRGTPDPRAMDAEAYVILLGATIDKMREKEMGE